MHRNNIVLDKAEALKADVLVISGDMFDKHVEAQRLKTALRAMFEAHSTPVVILPGNHDQKGLERTTFTVSWSPFWPARRSMSISEESVSPDYPSRTSTPRPSSSG